MEEHVVKEHILESNTAERERFERIRDRSVRAAWRYATEATTGGLPSWAERKAPGGKPGFDVAGAVAKYLAGGVTLREVAQQYGVSAPALGYHVRRAPHPGGCTRTSVQPKSAPTRNPKAAHRATAT